MGLFVLLLSHGHHVAGGDIDEGRDLGLPYSQSSCLRSSFPFVHYLGAKLTHCFNIHSIDGDGSEWKHLTFSLSLSPHNTL